MSSSNCGFLTCIQVSQEAGQGVWYSHLFKNLSQFVVIHTVKDFGIVNRKEIYVLVEEKESKWQHIHMRPQSLTNWLTYFQYILYGKVINHVLGIRKNFIEMVKMQTVMALNQISFHHLEKSLTGNTGFAKKFIWVFNNILESLKTLFGQPNNSVSTKSKSLREYKILFILL